jgi:GH35 family endo-1,4-beta-xylanase
MKYWEDNMKIIGIFVFVSLVLTACAPVNSVTSTPVQLAATEVAPLPTKTVIAPTVTTASAVTEVQTATIEPINPIPGLSIQVPKPDDALLVSAIEPFANAFKLTSAQKEQVKNGMQFVEKKDREGKTFVLTITPDGYPLLIATQDTGKWGWQVATPKNISNNIGFNVGVILGGYGSIPDYEKLVKIQKEDFNAGMVIFEGRMQNSDGSFDFSAPQNDAMIAQNAGLKETIGSNLIWPNDTPEWIKKGHYSKNQLKDIMTKFLQATVGEFKGKINSWIAVNEYSHPSAASDIYLQTIGADYVDFTFQEARRLDQNATLIYNDFSDETKGGYRYKLTKQIIDRLKAIDSNIGVGIQMHLNWKNPPDPDQVVEAMQSYGVPVYVTEFDVNMGGFKGSEVEREQFQANIYREMIAAAVRSGVCKQFNIFGLIDRLSVAVQPGRFGGNKDASPLIFHDDFSPKQSYFGTLKGLVDSEEK